MGGQMCLRPKKFQFLIGNQLPSGSYNLTIYWQLEVANFEQDDEHIFRTHVLKLDDILRLINDYRALGWTVLPPI